MKKTKLLLSLISVLMVPNLGLSTHIVGGELNYRCLGNDNYEITLSVYRDCYNGVPWFDNPASIGVFDENNNLVQNLLIPLGIQNDTLDDTLQDDCLVTFDEVCYHTTTYSAIVNLPYIDGGYQLAYQRCCRNYTILNVPDSIGATYYTRITEKALLECNTNARFKDWPPVYICVNHPIMFDHSAIDPDGDSIVYKMCTPFDGASAFAPIPQPPNPPPYGGVPWVPPYNEANMLGGIPLSIDSETGLLTGTPNTIGQFVVGICAEEYRNGELISTTRRDFQYNVGLCSITTSSFFAPSIQCGNFEVSFENLSESADDFEWYFNDPNNPNATTSITNPTYTFQDTGTYTIMLIAEPNNICADTSYETVELYFDSLVPDFDFELGDCSDSLSIQVTDLSTDAISTITEWDWELELDDGTVLTSDIQNPEFIIGSVISGILSLNLIAENGCEKTLEMPIDFPFTEIELVEELAICDGDSIRLFADSNNPSEIVSWVWSPEENILEGQNTQTPLILPDSSIIITLAATNQEGCVTTEEITVTLGENIPDLDVFPISDTIFIGDTIQITATNNPNYVYEWTPSGSLNLSNVFNPLANPTETTLYTLTVTDQTTGCVNSRSVLIVTQTLSCVPPHIFVPSGFTPNGDGKNDFFEVFGNSVDEMYLIVYDRWGEKIFESTEQSNKWDGTLNGTQLPPDVYGFYLRVGCVNGEQYSTKGNVTLIR